MDNKYVLAIDQGTTGSTAMIWSKESGVLGKENVEFDQYFPKPGWVEHDVNEIVSSVEAAISAVLAATNISGDEIACIGITNQRETSVLWDRRNTAAVGRAIVWQDRRTADRCQELREKGLAETILQKTGLVVDPYFSASKFEWMLNAHPECRDAERYALGTIDSYLISRLSGGKQHVSDESNASRTMLFDIHRGVWDQELCEVFRIPRAMLPTLVGNAETIAHTSGFDVLPDGIPISGVAGDQQSALFGQRCFNPGQAKCTFGTGAFLLMNIGETPKISEHRLLTTIAWNIDGQRTYALEGSCFVAGSAVQWLRDGMGIIASAPEVGERAQRVQDSEGVFLVPAFTGLGAPHWEPNARGQIFGLTRGTTADHICRATLEGVAHQIVDLVDSMQASTDRSLEILRVDGGMSASNPFLQIQADFLQIQVDRPQTLETTGLGAVLLAALGHGLYGSVSELVNEFELDASFVPIMTKDARESMRASWSKAIELTREAGEL